MTLDTKFTTLMPAARRARMLLLAALLGPFAAAAPGVEHRRTGWLVADADATAFAEGIMTLLDDPELADALGREARHYVEANCRWPAIAERVQAVYGTLLGTAA